MKEIKNILVAIDFKDSVENLLIYAESFASKFEAKVWVIHVAAPDPDFVGYEPGPQYIRDVRADELKTEHKSMHKISDRMKEKGLECRALIFQGPTIEMLIKEAEELEIDLLMVGSHKHGFLRNLFSESVSQELLKSTKIPLLAIPLDEE